MKLMTNALELSLTPTPPFDFAHTLRVLQRSRADGTAKSVEAGTLMQALQVTGQAVGVRLHSTGTVDNPHLHCTLSAETALTLELVDAATEQLRFYLSLDDDLSDFYTLAEKDGAFQPVLDNLYGYHQVKFPSLFSGLCWALITQRTPNSFAFKSVERLSASLGDAAQVAGQSFPTFPEPHTFLTDEAAALILEATNNTRKTERLIPLARAVMALDERALRTEPYGEVEKALKQLPGIGQWSADYVMLRALGRYERAPWTDTWLIEAISRVYTGGLTISRGDARKLAESYGWYQGLWVHYLKTHLW